MNCEEVLNYDNFYFNELGIGHLPSHLGITITFVGASEVRAELEVQQQLMAPNGFLHAGTVISLADTAAGYGCRANLPEKSIGFTTLEVKSNHMSTARVGTIECVAKAVHMGRTTQVWDATVKHRGSDKILCLFRCTQMILYPS